MNQKELIDAIASHVGNHGVAKSHVKHVLDALADVMRAELKKGGEITLPGICKLTVKTRLARKGRNPKTGEAIDIPAKRVPEFSALTVLKEAVA